MIRGAPDDIRLGGRTARDLRAVADQAVTRGRHRPHHHARRAPRPRSPDASAHGRGSAAVPARRRLRRRIGTHRCDLAAELARRTGACAISLDYRLASDHPFPTANHDGPAAYRELLDTGARPEHLVVAGDSAGGGLAIATLLAVREAGLPQPAAATLFSPWVDLTLSAPSMQTKHDIDPLFTRERLRRYATAYLGDRDGTAPLPSPLFADLTDLPALLIQVGSHEFLLDDAVRLAGDADVDVTLEIATGVPTLIMSRTSSHASCSRRRGRPAGSAGTARSSPARRGDCCGARLWPADDLSQVL